METITVKNSLVDRLDALNDPGKWDFNPLRYRYTASVEPYTLHVDDRPSGVTFQVEHERFGVLLAWSPESTVQKARAHAVDFARAHALGNYEPKHIED